MKVFISKRTCAYLTVVLFLLCISTIILSCLKQNDVSTLKIAIILQFIMFITLFVVLGYINKSLITLYSVFLIVFYVFQNGQLLLYSFDVEFDYFYVEKFSAEKLKNAVFFSNLCMFSAFASAIFSFDEKKGRIAKKIDALSPRFLYNTGIIGFAATGIVTFGLTVIKVIVWSTGRYSGVMAFEAGVPSVIGAVEALFPAFCLLTIVAGAKCGLKTRLIIGLFLAWGVIMALIGDRTTGLGVVVILLIIYYYGILGNSSTMNKTLFYLGCILSLVLITFASSFRNQEIFAFSSLNTVIVDVIYELGFSFFPLAAIMNMCPNQHGFLYGNSMLSSVITGFFPESLDVFGIFSNIADQASIPTKWIAARYQYGFGMDCSLNAEVYANFGSYGFIAMFIICAFVATCLKKVDYKSSENVFSQYTGLALLFGWFTLPRRRSYYIYSKIFWYVMIIGLFIGMLYLYSKKRGDHIVPKSI